MVGYQKCVLVEKKPGFEVYWRLDSWVFDDTWHDSVVVLTHLDLFDMMVDLHHNYHEQILHGHHDGVGDFSLDIFLPQEALYAVDLNLDYSLQSYP